MLARQRESPQQEKEPHLQGRRAAELSVAVGLTDSGQDVGALEWDQAEQVEARVEIILEGCRADVQTAAGNLSPRPSSCHGELAASSLEALNVDQSQALEPVIKLGKSKGIRVILPSDRQLRSTSTSSKNGFQLVAICEPKLDVANIESIRLKLSFDAAVANLSADVWVLYNFPLVCSIAGNSQQHISLNVHHPWLPRPLQFSFVHARCTLEERRGLWQALLVDKPRDQPWCIYGDFNVIISPNEKRGGRPFRASEGLDLLTFMEETEVFYVGFSGSSFTWCNNHHGRARIWKRLDRLLVNGECSELPSVVSVTHLVRHPSDHAPLRVSFTSRVDDKPHAFRFLNVWTSRASLLDVIRTTWQQECQVEEEFWKQKNRVKWPRHGDRNSKFFHATLRQRRLQEVIHRIKDETGIWVETKEDLSREAVRYFSDLFSAPIVPSLDLLHVIPANITAEENRSLEADPSFEEVKKTVFAMDGDSAAGSDGFTGFVKGRNISENYLLAQEIMSGMRSSYRGGNVALKLDMSKAYDRVSWVFLMNIMRRFGFGERFLDMVWRLISNAWFSVIINGASYGFFKSSRGLRQGDPISPALFVIGAEVLSRALNNLVLHRGYRGFKVPRGCPQVTHLAFADDVLIFANGSARALQDIVRVLKLYQQSSG
ncbi:uncharacterized protein LOC113752185 [Coffea eugenioides]|uniref:uncharacterized protein LOC113752185 n=1 Tax=Coffea eugenioides TaxID=49369 RepID=UPI000F60FDE9|nr:uncharacterized protein LOC113752185 [Coffea eugenioides]